MNEIYVANVDMNFYLYDAPPTYIYTLSLHDALPISLNNETVTVSEPGKSYGGIGGGFATLVMTVALPKGTVEIGKHTSELQSPDHLVCRLLLEKKKTCH